MIMVLAIVLVPLALYRTYQYQQANEQEREKYLPLSVAFTNVEFSGVPYNPPQQHVTFDEDTVLAIEGEIDIKNLQTIDRNFHARLPNTFQHKNTFWRVYPRAVSTQFRYMDGYVALLNKAKPIDYHYGIKQINDKKAEIFITDKNNKPLWKTSIVEKNDRYYPNYREDFFDLFRPLLTGNTHPNYIYWRGNDYQKKQFNEVTNTLCPFTQEKSKGSIDIKWNNQRIQLDKKYGKIQEQAFCSKSYAFLLLAEETGKKNKLSKACPQSRKGIIISPLISSKLIYTHGKNNHN